MPKILPANVAASPKATRTVSWISPAGSMYNPQKSSAMPTIARVAAVMSCMSDGCFISLFHCGECCSAKNVLPRTHAFAFPIRKRMFLPEHILQCGCKWLSTCCQCGCSDTSEIRCKGRIKKRSHQKMGLRSLRNLNSTIIRCIFGAHQRLLAITIRASTYK